jgi:hypothetical protein
MKYYIVALATVFAMFWDEAVITIMTMVMGRKLPTVFVVSWVICSGVLTSLLISYHVSYEYRIITMILISFAVLFSIHGYQRKEKYMNDYDDDDMDNLAIISESDDT